MKKISLLVIFTFLIFSGCSTIEPELDADLEIPQNYKASSKAKTEILEKWWQDFNALYLNKLIDQALTDSPDLLAAYEKIIQAEITLNSAGASYLPSVDLKAGSSSTKQFASQGSSSSTSKATSAEIAMSYELDIWDKIGANIRSANANVKMNIYDYEAFKLILISNITENYFSYVTTEERIKIAKKNLDISQKVLAVMQARLEFGAINELDVRREQTALYVQEAALLSLQNQALAYKNALAILVGTPPSLFEIQSQSLQAIATPSVGVGLPSELLLRRPDIAAQKEAIESSKALIQVADALRYPSFSLSASTGSSSSELLSFTNPTNAISAGVGMTYNIFDDGRLKNQRLIEESKAEATLLTYKKTVLNAFKEVEDALNDVAYRVESYKLMQKILNESQSNFTIASLQYKNGTIDFTTYLEIQRTFFISEEQLLVSKQENLNATLRLYKSLGGGFKLEQ